MTASAKYGTRCVRTETTPHRGYQRSMQELQSCFASRSRRRFRRLLCTVMKLQCFSCWRTRVPPTWLVICGALLVQVGFGLYPVVVKQFATKTKANPVIFSFYRDLCCIPVLFLCALIVDRKICWPGPKMLMVFILLGLLGMFGNQLLYILGVYWAGPNVASAFQPIIPVWTTILAIASCTEKIPSPLHLHTWAKLGGILLATGGAVELTLIGNEKHANSSSSSSSSGDEGGVTHQVFGYVALFGNTFCMAIYVLLQKRFIFNPKSDNVWKKRPVYVTAYSYFFGAVFMGLASVIVSVATKRWDEFIIPQQSVYALIYAIFIASALCYLLITWTNIHLSATIVTAFWPSQVLIAVVASYFITHDKLAGLQYIGAAMLIFALFLVLFSNWMEERLASVLHHDGDESALLPDKKVAYETYGPPITEDKSPSPAIN